MDNSPCYRVLVNSKGREQGLKEGDRVLSVNGQPTAEMTHADAQRVIRESSSGIELQIERYFYFKSSSSS
ncbi:hypothetical protein AVEN_42394-1 [Araneus ventricosus]|uniref:PDZ domain-containing protein n=1 Tax=Araneus ventricosus TaxID=182803 RepID=A0A4Y2KVF4_ARAVE|nr:hypothetical protein AVEN_42394-1 [Araneus ventricosus]